MQDYEARIDLLRSRSTKHKPSSTVTSGDTNDEEPTPQTDDNGRVDVAPSQHVDLFADFDDKMKKVKPMDEEKRLEQEKYEKQIGYLTYLGQDTNEALGKRNWYDVAPKQYDDNEDKPVEVGLKVKHLHDPMLRFLKKPFLAKPSTNAKSTQPVSPTKSDVMRSPSDKERTKKSRKDKTDKKERKKEKKKKKNHHHKDKRKRKRSSSDSDTSGTDVEIKRHKLDNLRKLREKRLQREKAEQARTTEFLVEKFPALAPPPVPRERAKSSTPLERPMPFVKQ